MAKAGKELMIPDELLINRIYLIREQKVMLDRHLAELYDVETKVLNQAVRRNSERFPKDFMFQLTKKGVGIYKVTICDLRSGTGKISEIPALCFYRTGCGYAFFCIKK